MILDQMKLIFDDEYSRLYFDEANGYYVLWLMISHVMWYDIYIQLTSEEVSIKQFGYVERKQSLSSVCFGMKNTFHKSSIYDKITDILILTGVLAK